MQDRTINAALLLLRARITRSDGAGREHVKALLILRRVPLPPVWPGKHPDAASHAHMKRLLLAALRDGQKTRGELATLLTAERPALEWMTLADRTDKALRALRLGGLAVQGERMWRMAAYARYSLSGTRPARATSSLVRTRGQSAKFANYNP